MSIRLNLDLHFFVYFGVFDAEVDRPGYGIPDRIFVMVLSVMGEFIIEVYELLLEGYREFLKFVGHRMKRQDLYMLVLLVPVNFLAQISAYIIIIAQVLEHFRIIRLQRGQFYVDLHLITLHRVVKHHGFVFPFHARVQ